MNSPSYLFPPEIRTAAIVPRWSVVWTLNRDYVSNHSYFVTFYAHQIARLLDLPATQCYAIMYLAMTHDLDETISGDVVSPVKKEIMDRTGHADAYIRQKMTERLFTVVNSLDEMKDVWPEGQLAMFKAVVKVADRFDALVFLVIEKRMGNLHIESRIPDAWKWLEEAWDDLKSHVYGPKVHTLWQTVVVPAVKNHENMGSHGI